MLGGNFTTSTSSDFGRRPKQQWVKTNRQIFQQQEQNRSNAKASVYANQHGAPQGSTMTCQEASFDIRGLGQNANCLQQQQLAPSIMLQQGAFKSRDQGSVIHGDSESISLLRRLDGTTLELLSRYAMASLQSASSQRTSSVDRNGFQSVTDFLGSSVPQVGSGGSGGSGTQSQASEIYDLQKNLLGTEENDTSYFDKFHDEGASSLGGSLIQSSNPSQRMNAAEISEKILNNSDSSVSKEDWASLAKDIQEIGGPRFQDTVDWGMPSAREMTVLKDRLSLSLQRHKFLRRDVVADRDNMIQTTMSASDKAVQFVSSMG
jgi:hypothetical protein